VEVVVTDLVRRPSSSLMLPTTLTLPPPTDVTAGYKWFLQANYDKALELAKTLQGNLDPGTRSYFINAVMDVYCFDRASCGAAAVSSDTKPMRQADLEETIYKGGPSWMKGVGRYHLKRTEIKWGPDAPREAINAFGRLSTASAPDHTWIGEYKQEVRVPITWDPIIYAEYGEWIVEVARWE
jgi:hypothetical protein